MKFDGQQTFFRSSSWTERFLRCIAAMIITLLCIVVAQSFFSAGSEDPQFLVYTFGLLVLAAGAQFLVFWARIEQGFRISGMTAWFLPWLGLLLLNALALSETPWRARFALSMNLLPLMAFFAAIHVSRSKRARWRLIALIAILTLCSGLFAFLNPEEAAEEAAGGGSVGQAVRSIFSEFENPAGIGAILLLTFFPMALLAVCPSFKPWQRYFGGYMAALFLAGIAFTRHFGVYLGLLAGGALAAQLLIRRRSARWICTAVLVAAAFPAFFHSSANVGCLRSVPVSDEVLREFSAEERRAGTEFLLPHAALGMFRENPVFGVGTGRFGDAFEKYRTPQWQTNPETPGSLYLHVLAEEGAVGALLFCGPLLLLFVAGVRACAAFPWHSDSERAARRRKMGILDLGGLPEERIALAAVLSGLLGVAVLFAVDYPRHAAGVTVVCGIFGGIAGFLASLGKRKTVALEGPRRHLLLPLSFAVPAVLLFCFLPVFSAEADFRRGQEALCAFFADAETGLPAEMPPDFSKLERAGTLLQAALRKCPDHGDAWCAWAEKFAFDCQRDPENAAEYAGGIRFAADRALACSEAVPRFFQMRAVAEMTAGDFAAARADAERADAMRPFNAPALLLSAEILRAFPQGVEEAFAKLERVAALLPRSRYVEKMRAVLSLDALEKEESEKGAEDAPAGGFAVPEF